METYWTEWLWCDAVFYFIHYGCAEQCALGQWEGEAGWGAQINPSTYFAFTPTEAHTEAEPGVRDSTHIIKKMSAVKDNVAPIL